MRLDVVLSHAFPQLRWKDHLVEAVLPSWVLLVLLPSSKVCFGAGAQAVVGVSPASLRKDSGRGQKQKVPSSPQQAWQCGHGRLPPEGAR